MPDLLWRPVIHRAQAVWLVFAGVLMATKPSHWWGRAWQPLIGDIPYLSWYLCAVYVSVAVGLWRFAYAHTGSRRRRKTLAWILLVGGVLNWVIGVFFFVSAFATDWAIMAGPFPLYVGGHMLLGAILEFVSSDPRDGLV